MSRKQLKARKMLEKRGNSLLSTAPSNDGVRSFSTKETVQQKYTPKQQVHKLPCGQSNGDALASVVPRCTLVAGQIGLHTGGKGAKTPMRKLTP
jgi:hypothetical protein